MVRFLPPDPDLTHLKNEAKALHRALQRGDPDVCALLRHVRRFQDAPDEAILAAAVPLTEVQFALARDYGFPSWPALRAVVASVRPPAGFAPDAEPGALVLPAPPSAKDPAPDHLCGALAMALSILEAPVDAVTLAGDSGRAFILQADARHKPYGADVPNLDIGWWPLDRWGAVLRLDFLSRAYGVPLREVPGDPAAYGADPAQAYRRLYEREVTAALRAGRPAEAIADEVHLVLGHDGGEPPLLGRPWADDAGEVRRLAQYPWCVIVLGDPGGVEPMDRARLDRAAIAHAVALGRDEVDLSRLPGKSSGRRSWQLWAEQVADPDLCGPHYYHWNVLYHLVHHRRQAAAYLRTMSGRHAGGAAAALSAAAAHYDAVTDGIKASWPDEAALATAEGRNGLLALIETSRSREAEAQQALAAAADAMVGG